ncbi:MAG TPA: 4-alpha-glucanotransferase [Acidimicrobiales bacterium]|nr:4-alpha-glucanotransferase [Acidimicrobiales bacterium]
MIDATRWGVDPGYWDVSGVWWDTPTSTIERVLETMGADRAEPDPPPAVTVRLDHQLPAVPPGKVVLEDGTEARVGGPLPPDLPAGYHRFEGEGGESFSLIVSPGRCPLPGHESWGFAAQLYGARSEMSWGMGDFRDLHRLGSWSSDLGAGLIVVNPLHATSPVTPQEPSPYYAGSRCFLNPIYLAVEQIPGASRVPGLERLAAEARRLNDERLIDRDRVWALKSAALQAVFMDQAGRRLPEEFERFRQERGATLRMFTVYSALCEVLGGRWVEWPEEYRHPSSAAVKEFAATEDGARRATFHAWLQWQAEEQLAAAGSPFGREDLGIVMDLAVGVDGAGADGWMFQDVFARGIEVGAPPDEFNTGGQNWALVPLDPWRLRSCSYRPWIESLRANLRHAGGIRVDHVMGLFRLYWIPSGSDPSGGAYVRYPHDDLLNILALEASRAGAIVAGEDLGTVEDSVRADLSERDVLSYRVWWFEREPPEAWPRKALGAVTTHDLPTITGVFDRSDLEAQQRLGLNPNEESSDQLRRKLLARTGCSDDAAPETVVERTYQDLSRAPCLLLAAGFEDALAISARPNMPGTASEWPNWRMALPFSIEEIETKALPKVIARLLNRHAVDPEP